MYYKANSLPPFEFQLQHNLLPLDSIQEAEYELDCLVSDYDSNPGFVIVKYDGRFYIVDGKCIYKGFDDYDDTPLSE